MLKPSGSLFVNLGDKYAGGGGQWAKDDRPDPNGLRSGNIGNGGKTYGFRAKSLMGLPWRYAIGCIDGQADPDGIGWILRAEVVWAKPNGLPESVNDRVRRSHEQWFHLVKNGRYFADVDPIREPYSPDAHNSPPTSPVWGDSSLPTWGVNGSQSIETAATIGTRTPPNPLGKLPGSVFVHDDLDVLDMPQLPSDDSATVWRIATQPLQVPDSLGVDHFAAFPTEWPRRIITAWSPSGICTVCGEPRRTVAERDSGVKERETPRYTDTGARHGGSGSTLGSRGPSAVITGTACACPDTMAPTRPAVVLDPFGGTGTTAMVARALGRYGISLDLSADYLRLAQWRIWDSDGTARVQARHQGRTYKPTPAADPSQLSLLDLTPSPLGANTR